MQINKTHATNAFIWGGIAFIFGLTIAFFVWNIFVSKVVSTPRVYENTNFGIKFKYPDSYEISEKDNVLSKNKSKHTISLLKDSDSFITIDIIDRDNTTDVVDWVKGNAETSYFGLSNGSFETASAGTKKIIAYFWFGDWNGNTLALIHNGRIFLLTVAVKPETKDIQADFVSILSTMEFI